MTCEISDECDQTATMWVERPTMPWTGWGRTLFEQIVSCDDCGPQLGYKILAPLEPSSSHR